MPAFLFAVTAFLSTPSARRATRDPRRRSGGPGISIHALREEGDPPGPRQGPRSSPNFYPRPPRGGRHGGRDFQRPGYNFYPRPPRGGRRLHHAALEPALLFLSTPSARRATDGLRSNLQTQLISIHALREEGDLTKRLKRTDTGISIHALREEGDGELRFALPSYWYFYPRPPRGGQHPRRSDTPKVTLFLSTPSARRATSACSAVLLHFTISIHALREEGDTAPALCSCLCFYFYPRPPRGGRPHESCRVRRP